MHAFKTEILMLVFGYVAIQLQADEWSRVLKYPFSIPHATRPSSTRLTHWLGVLQLKGANSVTMTFMNYEEIRQLRIICYNVY